MVYEIVVPAAVGSVIGYFTNWLAIKMLFKPRYPKYIFGLKIPFTPGLIPKERERIAKSIGQAVGVHLLDDSTILKAIEDIDVSSHIDETINSFITRAVEEEATLGNLINSFGEKTDERIIEFISKLALENISKVDVYVRDIIENALREVLESQKKLGELIPEEVNNYLDKVIHNNSPLIAESMKNAIMSENIEEKIKASIKQYISSKSGMLSMFSNFINTDSIYDSIKVELFSIFDDPGVHKEIEFHLIKYKEDALNREMKDIASSQDNEGLSIDNITRQIGNKCVEAIDSNKSKDWLEEKIKDILRNVLDVRISQFMSGEYYPLFIMIKRELINKLSELSIKSSPGIIEKIDIETLVENKLNEFEIDFTEKLILDISGRELNAITWLGGVLGLAIGLIQPLINHILKI